MPSATQYDAQPLPFENNLDGISQKTVEIHHDKLYVGYVNKMKQVAESLKEMVETGEGLDKANQTHSKLRGLRNGETFATNGVFLHERYFEGLGGDGVPTGSLPDALTEKFGSVEKAIAYINASCMAMRGWVVVAWDTNLGRVKVYGCDSHNQGGVWGCIPLIVVDVYEHSYFIDFGSDRKAYLEAFWKNFNWAPANRRFEAARQIDLSA